MKKQKIGLVLFWIGIIWAILWGAIGGWFVGSALRNLTMDELNQTMWAFMGSWYLLWSFGVPLGAIIAGMGILLYSGPKDSTVWKYGIGSKRVLVFVVF